MTPGDNRSGSAISVCIVCRNEADKLGPCLESVTWADEILVMDLESTDDSRTVAERMGARVLSREPLSIVEPIRNELAGHARNDWILAVDPDERVSPGLASELQTVATRADVDAVLIPFMNVDLGYEPTSPMHRYNPKPRMYRRSRVRWPERPNALPAIPGERLYRLPNSDDVVMVHERNRTIEEALDRVLRYGPAEARAMIEAGEVFEAAKMLRVLRRAFRKQFYEANALADGVPGLLRAGILIGHKFYVWAAFWQLSGASRTPADDRLLRRLDLAIRFVGRAVEIASAPQRVWRRFQRRTSR